jgi:aryl carrier-like protein
MRRMNLRALALAPIFALSFALVGCSPSPEDEANMDVMMQLDAEEAAIIEKTPTDCKKLEGEIATYAKSSSAKRKTINAWWDGLSKGKRQKLLESHKAGSYKLAMAMMKAVPCLDNVKTGMHAGD